MRRADCVGHFQQFLKNMDFHLANECNQVVKLNLGDTVEEYSFITSTYEEEVKEEFTLKESKGLKIMMRNKRNGYFLSRESLR